MFRSAVNSAFSISVNPNKRETLAKCSKNFTSFHTTRQGKSFTVPRLGSWIVGDVLRILGPLDSLFFPSLGTKAYITLLRECIKTKNSPVGMLLHAHLLKSGFGSELLVSNVLLDMYMKAGLFDSALDLFDEMPDRDVISWCTLIAGLVAHGFFVEAIGFFNRMQAGGWSLNRFAMSSMLKGCSVAKFLDVGVVLHGFIIKVGLFFDKFIEIGLVSMYAKCGCFDDALNTFYEIPLKCVALWNSMISGYLHNELFVEAIEHCKEMCKVGFSMDTVTLRVVARAAFASEMIEFLTNLHAYSIKIGLDGDTFFVVEFVRSLAKIGDVSYMKKLFGNVRCPDASLYSLLISGYHLCGQRSDAIELTKEFLAQDLDVKQGAFVSALKICVFKDEGEQIHCYIIKTGFGSCVSVGNSLISMYIRDGAIRDAYAVFHNMPTRDVVSWSAVMAGYVMICRFSDALKFFLDFRRTGLEFDPFMLVISVNACAGIQEVELGKQIHSFAMKLLGVKLSSFMSASLLHLYTKCGFIEDSARLFSFTASPHDLILTNVMLSGYCSNWKPEKAIKLFVQEHHSGFLPDHFTFSTILSACADLKSMTVCEQIHCQICKYGLELSDVVIGNGITKMYAKSGNVASACKIFYFMRRRSPITYWMLMVGFVQEMRSTEGFQMRPSLSGDEKVIFARVLRGSVDMVSINQARDEKIGRKYEDSGEEERAFDIMLSREVELYDPINFEYSDGVKGGGELEIGQLYDYFGGNHNYDSFIDNLNINLPIVSWGSFHKVQGKSQQSC